MRFDWLRNFETGGIRRNAARAALCLAVVVTVACEAGPEETGEDPDATGFTADAPGVPESLPEAPATDSIPEPESPALRAELEARGGTDVVGSVSLTPGAAGTTASEMVTPEKLHARALNVDASNALAYNLLASTSASG